MVNRKFSTDLKKLILNHEFFTSILLTLRDRVNFLSTTSLLSLVVRRHDIIKSITQKTK
jgi:hypothetical protein